MRQTTKPQQQTGMVSIMVTMILMVVISLIVLGFAQLSRREQTEALDRQLSTQAFLAAESGVNDARQVVQKQIANNQSVKEKASCAADPINYPITAKLDTGVSYTCLLVKTNVKSLTGTIAPDGASMVLPLESTGNITNLTINWTPGAGNVSDCAASVPAKPFPTTADWKCPYGVLRAEFVPVSANNRTAMVGGQKVSFLYPVKSGSGSTGYGGINGGITPMVCSATSCQVKLTNFNANKYMVKMSSYYRGGTFSIKADDGSKDLLNAQVQIDVTGRAQDVLRRIQVRIPVSSPNQGAEQAISSGGSLCKRYQYNGTSFTNGPATGHAADDLNPMCRPLAVATTPTPPTSCSVQHDIMMVLDTSKSMSNVDFEPGTSRRDKLISTSIDFVENAEVGTTNNIGIIGFSHEVTDKMNMSANKASIEKEIKNLPIVFGTQFVPPLSIVNDQYTKGAVRPTASKVMIFISDGEAEKDSNPTYVISDNLITKSRIAIYTIGIGNDDNFDTLKRMAAGPYAGSNSGRFFNVQDTAAYNAAIASITADVVCK